MHLLQTLLEELPSPGPHNRRPARIWTRYQLDVLFSVLLILGDNVMNVAEFSSAFALWVCSVGLAIFVVFPLGVCFQRFGAVRQSWSSAIVTSLGASAIFAAPTSLGSLIIGSWAWASLRAAKQASANDNVIDVDTE